MSNYIVFLKDGTKHSAWNTKREAEKQITVLKNNGYKNCYFDAIETYYDNGYYFV